MKHSLGTVVLSFACLVGLPAAAAREPHGLGDDVFCGARCARVVLAYYGQNVELIDIIKALQWPRLDVPVSLDQLSAFLNERGIYTHACRVDSEWDVVGGDPVIVHLRPTLGEEGHFVVCLPGADGNVKFTDGSGRPSVVSAAEFAQMRSGPCLLTSRSPISDPQRRFALRRSWVQERAAELAGMLVGAAAFCCGYYLFRVFGRRSEP